MASFLILRRLTFGAALACAAGQVHAESGEGTGVHAAIASYAGSYTQEAESAAEQPGAPEPGHANAAAEMTATRLQAASGPNSTLKVLIMRWASEHGIPYELADAVIRIESRYNAGARNGPHLGLTQINSATAQSLGYQGPAAGLLDADTNLRYGLKYLAQAYRIAGGDTCGTILRYQAGHRAQAMTPAARVYCGKVQAILAQAG